MKVRMIMGEYDQPEPYCLDVFLAPVEFPMEVEPLDEEGVPVGWDRPFMQLHTEEELRQWAEMRFAAHEIWDMPVAEAALVEGEQA